MAMSDSLKIPPIRMGERFDLTLAQGNRVGEYQSCGWMNSSLIRMNMRGRMLGLMESLKAVRKDAKFLGKWGINSWRNAEDGCCYCNNTLLSACLSM